MVYSNKFVMCIIVDGEIQKELANGTVFIPFGNEYSIRFRNKNERKAVVKFKIDGENASGDGYIIDPYSHIDIKRYAHKDCAFKFVSLDSQEAIDFGKNGSNEDRLKGLIEANFYLEKKQQWCNTVLSVTPQPSVNPPWACPPPRPAKYWQKRSTSNQSDPWKNTDSGNNVCVCGTYSYNPVSTCSNFSSDGATVEGSYTGQNFQKTFIDLESDSITIKLFLQGILNQKNVKREIEKENENLRKEIEKEKKQKELDFLLEENKRLKEELEKLKK